MSNLMTPEERQLLADSKAAGYRAQRAAGGFLAHLCVTGSRVALCGFEPRSNGFFRGYWQADQNWTYLCKGCAAKRKVVEL